MLSGVKSVGIGRSMRQTRDVGRFDVLARLRHRGDDLVCRDAVELVTEYLEDAMSATERRRFERHLAVCPHCTAYVEQTKLAAQVLGAVKPEPPSGETRAALIEAFRTFRDPDH